MPSSTILSDNGVSSGTSGIKTSGGNDGLLLLQTTTSGGTATTAVTVDTSQNVGIGTSSPTVKLDVSGGSIRINEDGAGTKIITIRSNYASLGPAINVTTNDPLLFLTNNTEQARIDTSGNFKFNSGYGSVATAYGCRAWVNFNGTGVVAIRASGNVSSITDNGTGDYTVNFTNALSDANYAVVGMSSSKAGVESSGIMTVEWTSVPSTTAVRLLVINRLGSNLDSTYNNVAIFR